MAEPSNLISVRSDVAAALLIDGLFEEAIARLAQRLPEVLDHAENPRAARLGYLARVIETERFAPARERADWLAALLDEADVGTAAARLADDEPLEKTAPSEGAPSWRIPGPGGHVRHFLALRAGDKRSWMLGFFARCLEELAGGSGPMVPGAHSE